MDKTVWVQVIKNQKHTKNIIMYTFKCHFLNQLENNKKYTYSNGLFEMCGPLMYIMKSLLKKKSCT